ncbi:MAG: sugar transferase, partial [Bacteroidota bacterium]
LSEPLAVICNYDFLQKDHFNLLKSIQLNPALKAIPFIVIDTEGAFELDREVAIRMGIDDCYTEPVNWNDLRQRLEFLYTFKPQIVHARVEKNEDFSLKIPIGKRMFDIVVATTALILLSPLMLIVALLIKMGSDGPVVYRSKRVGRGYQVFDFLKFRSMCQDADDKLASIKHLNNYDQSSEEAATSFIKIKNDPRVTPIGKFIRKTSIDELPQLFNVLRGEMSIVGNRPLPIYEAEQVTKDEWARRFLCPAGLTGLWQVSPDGKDSMTVEQRIGLDIEYAKKFSFWMDAKIISRTIPAMIQRGE